MMRNRRGSATILGLGVLLLVGMLIAGLLPWITAESRFGRNDQDAVQARYAAEAGLKRALAEFGLPDPKDWSWLGSAQQLTNTTGQATYTVTISPTPVASPDTGKYTITSTGAAGGMTRVSKMPGVDYKKAREGSFYATFAGGTLNVGGGTVVTNGGQIGYGGSFNDTVTCIDSNGVTQATNSCVVKAPNAPLPTYNLADFQNKGYPAPPAQNATLTQTKYYSNTSIDSNQVTWTGSPNMTTIIFINGNASFKNGMTIRAGANGAILVYATGNITFQNNAILDGAAVIAGGSIILQNNTTVDGALIAAGSVTFNNNSISYNAAVVEALGLTTTFTATASTPSSVTAATWEK